jgi:hypothetical protein
MDLKNNRKEIILGRLKQSAAKLWGYQDAETDGFDPVIDLLLGACASEFERLSTELNISQTRILEKVSEILLPEVYIHPSPSYAVIHAKPISLERFTDQADQFVFEKELVSISSNKSEQKKVFFSPVSKFRLIDAEVALMATDYEIIRINDLIYRETIIRSGTYTIPQKNTLWIGLKINPSVKTLKNVSFYFDWFNNPDKDELSALLQFSRWYMYGKSISVKKGYSYDVESKFKGESSDILSFLDINLKTEKRINHFFEDSFITITDDISSETRKFPIEFEDSFKSEELDKLKEELCWIKVELPEIFPVMLLASTFCTPNAFPVVNRRLHNSNRPYTLNEDLNILPIICEDHFFSIRDIISSKQINYQEVPFKRVSDFAPGTYTIRTDGVKRFDERNANDYIQYLMDLLREEQVAFRLLGSSLLEKELNDLQIIINRLNANISNSREIKGNTHFVIIKSETVEDVWLEFWSTSGIFSNNIHLGSILLHSDFDKKSLKLLTNTAGGKNPPDQVERTFLFKNELLTRDRVVTSEDIKVICFAELGNELKDVSISRRALMMNDRNKGFQNCIHVQLTFGSGKSAEEKESLVSHLKKTLQQKSSCIYKYHFESSD